MNITINIPESVAHLTKKWELSSLRPLVELSPTSNYLVRAYSAPHQTDVVLKILVTDAKEPEALQLLSGHGCIKLLAYDAEYHGLLLENITPGTTLSALFPHDDARSLEITAALIQKMQRVKINDQTTTFETVEQWLELLQTFSSKKIPAPMQHKAYALSQQLLNTPYTPVLLHGDLHHENILQCSDSPQDSNSWIVIDPKGVVGPSEFEIIRFLMNPIPALLEHPHAPNIIQNRIAQLHTLLGYEPQRLKKWAFVQAILSACWAEQGGGEKFCHYFIALAKIIENL